MRKFFALAIMLFLTASAFASQIEYDKAYLAQLGIDLTQFKLVAFSKNGSIGIGLEKVNSLSLRAKGFVWVLRVFRVDAYNRLGGARSILLRVSEIENIALDNKGENAILAAQYGTEFMEVNLTTGKIKILFQHRDGTAGFRAQAFLANRSGKFVAQGYFYDSQGYWLSDAITQLNPAKPNSSSFFEKTWNIGKTFKNLGNVRNWWISSGAEGFIATQSDADASLYHYNDGKLTLLDTAQAFAGIAAVVHRVLYFALRQNGARETIIKDTLSGKSWVLASGSLPYLYPYLSDDGKTAVVALIDLQRGLISFYYARESDNFKLVPLEDLQNIAVGTFRLAPNGERYSFENKDGLFIGTLP